MPRLPGRGQNTQAAIVLIGGPSTQATALAASMAYANNTASPMARGSRVWAGDPGYAVNRWSGKASPPTGDPSARAVAPVAVPVGAVYGFGGGPSSPPAYPSTGDEANYGSVAALDLGKLGNLGWGG